MKFKLLFVIVFVVLGLSACGNGFEGGSDTSAVTKVNIDGYLGTCSDFHEGHASKIAVDIDVDRILSNGASEIFWRKRFWPTNDYHNSDNYEFEIMVPETGTYAITVNAEADECLSCCVGQDGVCPSMMGKPQWRAVSTHYNATSAPPIIYLPPPQVACY